MVNLVPGWECHPAWAFSSVLVVRLEQREKDLEMTRTEIAVCEVMVKKLDNSCAGICIEKLIADRQRAIIALESVVKMLNDSNMQTMVSIEAIKVASKAIKETGE